MLVSSLLTFTAWESKSADVGMIVKKCIENNFRNI